MADAKHRCSYCGGGMRISKLTCEDCDLALEGDLHTPRLYRLSAEEQRFVELFVLASGSLKAMAQVLEVSYPTIRSRLDRLISALEQSRTADEARKQQVLDDIGAGRVPPKKGMRMIDNL